jgi:hypothetical protein
MSGMTYPAPETWEYATARQARRAARSFEILRQKAVPVYWGPLTIPDEDEVARQEVGEVIRRILVLWIVTLRGDGVPQGEALDMFEDSDLWEALSPAEREFLLTDSPSVDDCRKFVWRLESIWVLLWALEYVDELAWPHLQCDVSRTIELLERLQDDVMEQRLPRLRELSEILDVCDLTMRIHWAIRDAYLHRGGILPSDFDWSGSSDFLPVVLCDGTGVIEERHHTLVWLTNGLTGIDWDDMDTST